jgi:hypothetical protein
VQSRVRVWVELGRVPIRQRVKWECVFRCHGEEREFAVGLVDDANRGAEGFADMISMGESTLGLEWNTDKSGGLASLHLGY